MTLFQTEAELIFSTVLDSHGIAAIFEHAGFLDDHPWRSTSFLWKDEAHVLEIYHDTSVMMVGDKLYEVYLASEVNDDQSYLRGFAARLDRYLTSGEWEGPDETAVVWRKLRRLWVRAFGRYTS